MQRIRMIFWGGFPVPFQSSVHVRWHAVTVLVCAPHHVLRLRRAERSGPESPFTESGYVCFGAPTVQVTCGQRETGQGSPSLALQ